MIASFSRHHQFYTIISIIEWKSMMSIRRTCDPFHL